MLDDAVPAALRLPAGRLLEGIVTTLDADGTPHIAPMGTIVDAGFTQVLLRPFSTSTTFANLKRTRQCVLNVTDDVELFARAAVGCLTPQPPTEPAKVVEGVILADCCRWYALHVDSIDDRTERTEIIARVVGGGRNRDFFGFNRAKHAVIEAAILATRIRFLDASFLRCELSRMAVIVEKTGGVQEHVAFEFLRDYFEQNLPEGDTAETPRQ